MLELQDICKIYKTKSEEVHALDKVNLYFKEKGMVFITGKSGSGKTTMLNVIGGLDTFDSGDMLVKGKSMKTFKQKDFDNYRNTFIGFVFQEYNLLEEMTVDKNISLAMELQGEKHDENKINEILNKVDLVDLNNRYPQELSGGQKQRVAIARALIKNPKIILTDEPTGALDTQSGIQVMDLLKKLSKEKLVIIVSHNLELANTYADRVIEMKDGKVENDYEILSDKSVSNVNMKVNKDKVLVKRGSKLSKEEIEKLTLGIKQSKDIQVIDRNIFTIEKPTKQSKPNNINEEPEFIKGKLGFWNNIKLGFNSLKVKPIRLVATILLCAMAFSIFGLFDTMAIYDKARLTANTLANSNVPAVTLRSSIKEDNHDEYSISLGDGLLNRLNDYTGLKFKGVYNISSTRPSEIGQISTISKYYISGKLNGAVEFDEAELNQFGFKVKQGRFPTAFDEIAISEYYANCIVNWVYNSENNNYKVLSVNDIIRSENEEPLTLTLNKTKYKVVGIIDTGVINKKYDKILEDYASASSTLINEFTNYINNSFNMVGFVKSGFVSNKYVENKNLISYINSSYSFDFDYTVHDRQVFYTYNDLIKINNSTWFLENNKNSLNNNELLVNVQLIPELYESKINLFKTLVGNSEGYEGYADNMQAQLDKLKTTQTTPEEKFNATNEIFKLLNEVFKTNNSNYKVKTLVTKRDTTKYESDGSGNNLKVELDNNEYFIVGFYTGINVNKYSCVLTESGLNNLGINTLQGPYTQAIAKLNKNSGAINKIVNLVSRTSGLMYSSGNNVIAIIDVNQDFLKDMSLLFLIASGVFAVFAVAMMFNYIATSIANKHTEIGILRALGASGTDILKMFLTESIMIAIINALISNVITGVCCIFVNMFLKNIMNISITLASYSVRQFGIITALSLGVAIISSIIPITKLSTQKPIEAIRR